MQREVSAAHKNLLLDKARQLKSVNLYKCQQGNDNVYKGIVK